MALLKLYGISQVKNSTLAAHYFTRASELGHKDAMTAIGVMLLNGDGIGLNFQ